MTFNSLLRRIPFLPCHRRRRAGITSAMAMLYLTLFATLSLGFYASVTTSVQIAKNDLRTAKALLAAESGVQFMRYHLANVNLSPTSPDAMAELCDDLKARLEGTSNLGGNHVTLTNNTIYIPGETGSYIKTNGTDNSGFSAVITDHGGNIVCTVMGRAGLTSTSTASKGVSLDFKRMPITSSVFDYAVAAKGKVMITKGTLSGVTGISDNSIATMMSAKNSGGAMTVSGGTVGGDINVVGSLGNASVTGGNVGGTSNIAMILSQHTHVVGSPTFPVFDTTVFKQYATNTYNGKTSGALQNVRIPPNTNPKFTGNVQIQGIVYIESPNQVTFQGDAKLQGFIVFENAGSVSQNTITMTGNFSEGTLPAGSQYDALRTTTGIAILAPTTALTMSGSVDSQVRGNMILGTFENSGASNIQFDQGSLLTLDTSTSIGSYFHSSKSMRWSATGKNNQPSQGVTYDSKYIPVEGSYRELN